MKNNLLCVLVLVSASAVAGNAPVPAMRGGPSAVAATSQTLTNALQPGGASQGGAGAPAANVSGFPILPGAYKAAIANGATPTADGTVQVTINGATLTVDAKDAVVPR
ncbi:MAG: hypothetical protein V4688_06090 [Pseudomonadota bacterium]